VLPADSCAKGALSLEQSPMSRTNCLTRKKPQATTGSMSVHGLAFFLLLSVIAPACRAESALQSSSPRHGPIAASAQLDFRITVLPSLSLAAQAGGLRVQANSGTLTMQRDGASASTQLRPSHRVVDAELRSPALDAGERITIASP
jgi:uncharacterized protein (DUF2345 family)